ncbi:YfhO family protein [Flavobacteriales bacterium]|nr:YfhO family protein [Flavobacteriales bacterium]
MSDRPNPVQRLRAALPHVLAIAVLMVIAGTFYSKSFDGYRLRMPDIEHHIATTKEVNDHRARTGEQALWTDSQFGGMPTFQLGMRTSDVNAGHWLGRALRMGFPRPADHLLVALLCAYLLAAVLGCGPWISALVAIGFGLSSINILYLGAGHAAKVMSIATLPGILAGVLVAYRRNLWLGAGLASAFTAINLSANHLQMTYYLAFLVAGIGIAETVRLVMSGAARRALLTGGVLLAAAGIAVIPNGALIKPTLDYTPHTTRGEVLLTPDAGVEVADTGLDKDYILQYSMGRGEWWSIMVPDIKGGNNPLYWGEQLFSGGAFYFGAILMALFMASLVLRRDVLRWPMLAVGLLAIVLSWRETSGLTDFFLEYVPGFAKFRDTKMMLMLIQCMLPIGVGLLLKDVVEGKVDWGRKLFIAAGIPVALLLLFAVMPTVFFDFESHVRPDRAVEQLGAARALEQRLEVYGADVWRSFGLVLLAMLALLAAVRLRAGEARPMLINGVIGLLAVVTLVEMQSVARRYQPADRGWVRTVEYKVPYTPGAADQAILADRVRRNPAVQQAIDGEVERVRAAYPDRIGKREQRVLEAAKFAGLQTLDHFRVLNLRGAFSDATTSFFHRSVGGYHGAKLRRYQDLIERVLQPEQERFASLANSAGMDAALAAMPVHAMLNTQYIIYDPAQQPIPNGQALGNAWFSTGWFMADGADAEMAAMESLKDPRNAVVPEAYSDALAGVVPGAASTGRAELLSFTPDFQEYRVSAPAKGLLVFSEVHYPEGWQLTIDGEPADLLRVNYALRGMVVPAGEHTVEMAFELPSVQSARTVASLGSGLLLLFVLGTLAMAFVGRGAVEEVS